MTKALGEPCIMPERWLSFLDPKGKMPKARNCQQEGVAQRG